MKIKRNRTLTINKFYRPEDIEELYHNGEIELASYDEAIDFMNKYLTTENVVKDYYQWIYNGKHLCYYINGKKVCTHQFVFYIKGREGGLRLMILSKYCTKVEINTYSCDIFRNYKFMALI